MAVVLVLLVGILANIEMGESCEQALHRLRDEGLRIEATNTVERSDRPGEVLAYTLTKGKKKTAILGCALEASLGATQAG